MVLWFYGFIVFGIVFNTRLKIGCVMNKKAALVSIILGVYNQEKYVRQAIESVLSQTYKEIELIIYDNGSTDNSRKVIDEYSSLDFVNVLFYKKNTYLGKVANDAINAATGDYVCFIAGDDYYFPQYIEKHLAVLEGLSEEYGVVYSGSYIDNEVTGEKFIDRGLFNKSGDIFDELIESQGVAFIHAFTPFLRRKVFDVVRYNESIFCEGEMIFIRIAEYFKFQYIDIDPLYVSRDHDSNQGKNYKENSVSFLEQSQYLINMYPHKKRKLYNIISRMFVRNAWISTRIMGDKKWTMHCVGLAVKYNPVSIFNIKLLLVILFLPLSSRIVNKIVPIKDDGGRNRSFIDVDYKNKASSV